MSDSVLALILRARCPELHSAILFVKMPVFLTNPLCFSSTFPGVVQGHGPPPGVHYRGTGGRRATRIIAGVLYIALPDAGESSGV